MGFIMRERMSEKLVDYLKDSFHLNSEVEI